MKVLLNYLQFWLAARTANGIHSPFVFQLYNEVLFVEKEYYCFGEIEKVRRTLLTDNTPLPIKDLGAGSKNLPNEQRTVRQIVKYSVSKPKIAQLIFKLIDFLQPQTVIELGTCLGLTTLYMAEAMPSKARLYTFEGSESLIEKAKNITKKYFEKKQKNISFVLGDIAETLPKKLTEISQLDVVFFDANHRKEPTLQYFETCLAKTHEDSLFIFDDIYWSEEMKSAWQQIQSHSKVTLTIDLFEVGLVFFRKKQPKQHFKLR
ncbi:MAG: methyltransferase domain-containing protein [Cytophagales bacterium]|nr:MAG: methyltransferase domain-containing protein [Cytophagales bacterium]